MAEVPTGADTADWVAGTADWVAGTADWVAGSEDKAPGKRIQHEVSGMKIRPEGH